MIYSRFQKAIQDDKLTVVGLSQQVEHVKRSIRSLLDAPLLGGWEMQLAEITPENMFHGVQLTFRERRRHAHHSLVSDIRDFSAVRNEYLSSLLNFLDDRFSSDASPNLEPLAQLDRNISDEQLKNCHDCLVPDLIIWFPISTCRSFVCVRPACCTKTYIAVRCRDDRTFNCIGTFPGCKATVSRC